MSKIIKTGKVIIGSFLISFPSIFLPWGYGIKAAQALTIEYKPNEAIQLNGEIQTQSSYEFCDLDSTISNLKLNELQGDFQEWPEFEDPLIKQMSKRLNKIARDLNNSLAFKAGNPIVTEPKKIIENVSKTEPGLKESLNLFAPFFFLPIWFIGVDGVFNIGRRSNQRKKLAGLMIEAYDFGNSYYKLKRYYQSQPLFFISLAAALSLENELILIRSLEKIANISTYSKEYETAFNLHNLIFKISQEEGDGVEAGNALNKIGEIHKLQSQHQKALDSFKSALEAVRDPNQTRILPEEGDESNLQLNKKVVEGQILNNIGELYNEIEKYSQALEFSQQALVFAREASDRTIEAKALNNLGVAYKNQGKFTEALEVHQQALIIYQDIADSAQITQTQTHLGSVYNSLGEYAVAAQLHQQALATAQSLKNSKIKANIISNIGYFYNSLGQDNQALKYHQLALEVAREIQNSFLEGRTLNEIGNIYVQQGKYDQALTYHQQVLAIAEKSEIKQLKALALTSIGRIQHQQGQWFQALKSIETALVLQQEIGNQAEEAIIFANLAEIYINQTRDDEALELLQQSLSTYQAAGDKAGEGFTLNLIALAYLKQGKYVEAEEILWKALEVLEPLRTDLSDTQKISIFDTQVSIYSKLQQALIGQNKTEAALEVAERGRARPLIELLSERYKKYTLSLPDLAKIKQIAKTQNATLVEYSIIYKQVKLEGRVQSKESELYIWVIKPTGEVEFRRTNLRPLWQQKTSLSGLVQTSRQSMGIYRQILKMSSEGVESSIDSSTSPENLQQLYQLLIEPIAELLPTDPNERVIFIPQGELFLVPFAALKDAENQYLIRKHTILTAPAIQILELTQQQRKTVSGQDILIVGNPTMPTVPLETNPSAEEITAQLSDTRSEPLTPLPGAEQEAIEIAQIFQTEPLLNDQATKAAVLSKMPSSRIIHLATHGLLDSFGFGIPGAIALAPDTSIGEDSVKNADCSLTKKEGTAADWIDVIHYLANPPKKLLNFDGFLTSKEILDLQLNAELVVLSACSTGGGEITGDGVLGLSRAFIAAGVPSLIVSLWNVKDQPTAELMTLFYQNLKENPDKAQALRQAMLTLADQYPDQPQNWAAFTLIGEAE